MGRWQAFSKEIYLKYYFPKYGKEWFDSRMVFNADLVGEEEQEIITKQYNKPYDKTLIEYQKLLEDYCCFIKENGLKLLVLIPPYSDYYKKRWKKDYYIELIANLKKMQLLYHIDYLDMSHEKFPDYCFRDSGHLNRIGAIYVAEEINKWLT